MANNINQREFEELVLNEAKASVIDIYTTNCPNCRTLAPLFEHAEKSSNGQYNFFKLDARENMDLVKSLKVLGVPTLLFYRHGKLVDKKTGVISSEKIEKRLKLASSYSQETASKKEIKGFFKMPWK